MVSRAWAVLAGSGGSEIFFVDAISEAVGYAIEDGSPDFSGGHLS